MCASSFPFHHRKTPALLESGLSQGSRRHDWFSFTSPLGWSLILYRTHSLELVSLTSHGGKILHLIFLIEMGRTLQVTFSCFWFLFLWIWLPRGVLGILEPHYSLSFELYLEANLNQSPNNSQMVCVGGVVVVVNQGWISVTSFPKVWTHLPLSLRGAHVKSH